MKCQSEAYVAMITNFLLGHYRFTLVPETTINMPKFNKGNVLRGAFGSSLKHIVCAISGQGCGDCLLKDKCAYVLIFNPIGLGSAKRLKNTPRGFVVKPPLEIDTEYSKLKPLSFEMVLIGNRINYLPYILVALMELGKYGIGENRGRFKIGDISILKSGNAEPIYDPATNTVKNLSCFISGNEITEYAKSLKSSEITLHFLTPTRIKYNPTGEKGKSEVIRIPEFHHLIRRLRDRANALATIYCGGSLDIDYKGIAEQAKTVKTKEINLKWIEKRRYRRKEPCYHDQSGFTGSITFVGDLTEFLSLLALGEYIHIGEDAVFGNGWYRTIN